MKMKHFAGIVISTLLVGCATGPEAQTGTVLGGIIGATTGGIIGHQTGRGLEGAAIGGTIGALGGNMYGNAQDQRNYYRQLQRPPSCYQQQPPVYHLYQRNYYRY